METAAVSAQAQQRRQRLKELLITQLAKQFGALSDPKVRAIITAEAERALANGKVAAEDIRQLEANIRRTINFTTSGNLSGPKAPADTSLGSATAERLNWQSLYEYKLIQGDQAERKRLQREKDARELLKSQLRHQIAEQEAARRKAEAQALEYQEEERKQHERRLAEDREKAAQHAALVERDRAQNREHMRLAAKKREEEAELRRLEDERTLAAIRQEEELAKREKARQAVEKAKRLEFAKLADERSARLKAEAKARETAEQQRLDAVWKEILDEQERKREEGLKRMFEKQVVRAEAYGKSAGAEMAERARKDEMNMLRWQAIYAQQQEERERRDKQRIEDSQQEILRSLKQQMALAEQRKAAEKEEDARLAAIDREKVRISQEIEARLREEARKQALAYQGELAVHARMAKQSQLEGMLSESYMSQSDKQYNSHLIRAVIDYQQTGKLADIHAPLG